MNIYLPLALAVEFKDFTLIDIIGYGRVHDNFVI